MKFHCTALNQVTVLSYRAKTSIQQKLPAQLEKQLESFVKPVKELQKAHSFSPELIINMDETPLYFDTSVSCTIHKIKETQIRVKSTGTEKDVYSHIIFHCIRKNASSIDYL